MQNQVSAGSINLNGTLTIEVQRPGSETVMGDVVRLVEEAQGREAPVQRLADKVFLLNLLSLLWPSYYVSSIRSLAKFRFFKL